MQCVRDRRSLVDRFDNQKFGTKSFVDRDGIVCAFIHIQCASILFSICLNSGLWRNPCIRIFRPFGLFFRDRELSKLRYLFGRNNRFLTAQTKGYCSTSSPINIHFIYNRIPGKQKRVVYVRSNIHWLALPAGNCSISQCIHIVYRQIGTVNRNGREATNETPAKIFIKQHQYNGIGAGRNCLWDCFVPLAWS